ncbi:MAG TPA: hypothetical protein VE619_11990 [Nitrososphaeraceae archaeon]|nr:hypothetical protein [Nitrososphaeraceae archaeon]
MKRNQICRKIKQILKDKITERKITAKWIEKCLPSEYKRKYNDNKNKKIKSELSSLSDSKHQDNDDKNNNDDSTKVDKHIIFITHLLSSGTVRYSVELIL